MDSYASIEGLDILGINVDRFAKNLNEKGVRIYKSFFSNFQRTKYAMPSFLHMNLKINDLLLYQTSPLTLARIITGEGQAYKIFQRNSYEINLIHCFRYLIQGGPCKISSCTPSSMGYFKFVKLPFRILLGESRDFWEEHPPVEQEFNKLMVKIKENKNKNYFTYLHFYNPGHTEVAHGKTCDERYEIKEYSNRIRGTNEKILRLVNTIEQSDPESIVIIASDHGPIIFNQCNHGAPLRTANEIIERQGAFLAIKWGNGYDGRFDN